MRPAHMRTLRYNHASNSIRTCADGMPPPLLPSRCRSPRLLLRCRRHSAAALPPTLLRRQRHYTAAGATAPLVRRTANAAAVAALPLHRRCCHCTAAAAATPRQHRDRRRRSKPEERLLQPSEERQRDRDVEVCGRRRKDVRVHAVQVAAVPRQYVARVLWGTQTVVTLKRRNHGVSDASVDRELCDKLQSAHTPLRSVRCQC
jgi:hypothetical protein